MSRDVRRIIRVVGRVQGVGFRYFAQRAAQRLGVHGWVRNESDGSVACDVQGDVAAVERFLEELRTGPSFSRVDEVVVEDAQPVPALAAFEIR